MSESIIFNLYKKYYVNDQTPAELVTSYWRYYHGKAQMEVNERDLYTIHVEGFGDLQNASLAYMTGSWLTIVLYLAMFPNRWELIKTIKVAQYLTKSMGLSFTYDCFRQMCSLALVRSKLKNQGKLTMMSIGDGYGFLSGLYKKFYPNSSIVLVDLGKSLFFQARELKEAFPNLRHYLVQGDETSTEAFQGYDFIFCPAEHVNVLQGVVFDFAYNIASMQEMTNPTIKKYFDFLRANMTKENLFYCCNRIEKIMDGGEITRFEEYPWDQGDRYLVDADCPWMKFFISGQKTRRGFKIGQWRVPLINYFDGDLKHRLTILKTFPK